MTTRLEAAILGCKAATLAGKSGYDAAQFVLSLFGYSDEMLGSGVNRYAYSFGKRFILKTPHCSPSVDSANEREAEEIANSETPDDCIGVLYYDGATDLLFMEKAHSLKSLLHKKSSSGKLAVSESLCSQHQEDWNLKPVGINDPENCRYCYLEDNYDDCHIGNIGLTGKGAMVMIDFVGCE